MCSWPGRVWCGACTGRDHDSTAGGAGETESDIEVQGQEEGVLTEP